MNGYPQSVSYGGQQVMPQGLAPQGLFGGMLGGPVGGMIGRGIGGWLGNPALGAQIGQIAGGIGGSLLPFQSDPMAAYAQQLQQLQQLQQQQGLAPQGFFGNLLGQIGQPLGNAIGGIFGHSGLGSTIGSAASHLGRLLPFQADPIMAAYAQQLAQQQAQQQLAPQGFFGNLLGQIGQPLGSAIGGIWGNQGLGSNIGNIAGRLVECCHSRWIRCSKPHGRSSSPNSNNNCRIKAIRLIRVVIRAAIRVPVSRLTQVRSKPCIKPIVTCLPRPKRQAINQQDRTHASN